MRNATTQMVCRWTLTSITAFSLLGCIGAVSLWVRSQSRFDNLCWINKTSCTNLVSLHGKIYLQLAKASAPLWGTGRSWYTNNAGGVQYSVPLTWQCLGFATGYFTNQFGTTLTSEHEYVVPYWFLSLTLAALPFAWGRKSWRRRVSRSRQILGSCLHCGYSLTGNTSGVCPECGAAVVPALALSNTREPKQE